MITMRKRTSIVADVASRDDSSLVSWSVVGQTCDDFRAKILPSKSLCVIKSTCAKHVHFNDLVTHEVNTGQPDSTVVQELCGVIGGRVHAWR